MTGEVSSGKRPGAKRAITLILALLIGGSAIQAEAQDVNGAMQAFITAMVQKNAAGILAAFSRQSPWHYQPYEIGTLRARKAVSVSPGQMARDFRQRRNWYDFFTAEPNGYTFRVNFMRSNRWRKRGSDTFVAPDSDTGKTYIKWRREGNRWVIAEIGEVTP
jgi:hypothetical protein